MKTAMSTTRERYDALRALGLKLDLTRGQPGDDDFDLSNAMLTIVDDQALVTPSGVSLRNYPGGIAGLKEAREMRAGRVFTPDEERRSAHVAMMMSCAGMLLPLRVTCQPSSSASRTSGWASSPAPNKKSAVGGATVLRKTSVPG